MDSIRRCHNNLLIFHKGTGVDADVSAHVHSAGYFLHEKLYSIKRMLTIAQGLAKLNHILHLSTDFTDSSIVNGLSRSLCRSPGVPNLRVLSQLSVQNLGSVMPKVSGRKIHFFLVCGRFDLQM